jgi:hypothetical protein
MAITDPTDIAGLIGWYDADDAATITSSSGVVDQWDNKTTGTGDFTATTTTRPTTGTATVNTRNALGFDGSDDQMTMDMGGTRTTPTAIYVVAHFVGTPTNNADIIGMSDGRVAMRPRWTDGGGHFVNQGSTLSNSGFLAADTTYVWGFIADGASSVMRVNGTATTGNAGSNSLQNTFRLGTSNSSQYVAMNVCEIVIYDAALTSTDLDDLDDYFTDRWINAPAADTSLIVPRRRAFRNLTFR